MECRIFSLIFRGFPRSLQTSTFTGCPVAVRETIDTTSHISATLGYCVASGLAVLIYKWYIPLGYCVASGLAVLIYKWHIPLGYCVASGVAVLIYKWHIPSVLVTICLLNIRSCNYAINNIRWWLVSAFRTGHHQTMHHFELKTVQSPECKNWKKSQSLYRNLIQLLRHAM